MRIVFLDKREWVMQKLASRNGVYAAVVILVVVLIPIWPDRIEARCSIKPSVRSTLRAIVPGFLREVKVHEGEVVRAGQELAVLHNPEVESAAARTHVELITAQSDYSRAQLSYANLGTAVARRDEMNERAKLALEQRDRLIVRSPIDGVIATRNPQDEAGSYRDVGDTIFDIAGLGPQVAEAYVAESDLRDLRLGQPADVFVAELGRVRKGTVAKLAKEAVPLPGGLMHVQDYKGLEQPRYYIAEIALDNAGAVADQSTATAKIKVGRISFIGILRRSARDFLGRKLW